MPKKAIIVVSLVDESEDKTNDELEKEIFDELPKAPPSIPWMKEVEKVEIVEN
jgi:hypothetical protein